MSGEDGIRLDKWLWHARFFKNRTLASQICAKGRVRVDGDVVRKAHHIVRIGNVLTFPKAKNVRVVRIEGLGTRRGPASEAQALYSEIDEAAGG